MNTPWHLASASRSSSLVGLALFWLTLVAAPGTATAQAGWSDAFAQPGITGRTFAVGSWQGDLYAGGDLAQVSGTQAADLMRLDGSRWHRVGASSGVSGTVRAITEFGGELVIGGELVAADGAPVRGVARWNGTRWAPLGAGLTLSYGTSEVFALEVYAGDLYAAGRFDGAGGVTTSGIARWDGTGWTAVGGGLVSASANVPEAFALEAASDGRLYVGGAFVNAGATGARSIAAWDGTAWSALGSGSTSAVRALHEHQGALFAGGDFAAIGGVPAARIARWNGASWSALGTGLDHLSVHSQVFSLATFGGDLLVGGKFTTAGGQAARHAARWNGSSWSSPGGVSGSGIVSMVLASTVWNGRWVVGGEFHRAGRTTAADDLVSRGVAAWDGADWHALGEGLGTDAEVRGFARYQGELVALGRFSEIGSAVTNSVAVFDGRQWRGLGGSFSHAVLDAVEFQGDLIVAGEFRTLNGATAGGIARWNGTAWSTMNGGLGLMGARRLAVFRGELYAAGYGTPMRWTGTAWQALPTQISGTIHALTVFQNRLYIAGNMNNWTPPDADVFAWDGVALTPVGGDFDQSVQALYDFQGLLLAGGWFTQCAGTTCNRLALWNGSSWIPFGNGFGVGSVDAIMEFDGGLVVGGNLGGANILIDRGAGFVPLASSITGAVSAVHADAFAGQLWIGGTILRIEGVPAHNLGRYDTRPEWLDLGGAIPGTSGRAALAIQGSIDPATAGLSLRLRRAAPNAAGAHVIGFGRAMIPVFGGTLVPLPHFSVPFTTDATGTASLPLPVLGTLPTGLEVVAQSWFVDPGAAFGLAASNGVARQAP